jgi:hypothetical protein
METNNDISGELKQQFPELFLADRKYRNDIPIGWYALVKELLFEISVIVKNDEQLKQDFYITQMKEKLGGLRIYTSVQCKEINKLISAASDKSYSLCAECSNTAKLKVKHNYVLPLCEGCSKKYGYSEFDDRVFIRKDCILGEIIDGI